MNRHELLSNKLLSHVKDVADLIGPDKTDAIINITKVRLKSIDFEKETQYSLDSNGLLDFTMFLVPNDPDTYNEDVISPDFNYKIIKLNIREGEFLPIYRANVSGEIIYADSLKELDNVIDNIIKENGIKNAYESINSIEFITEAASFTLTFGNIAV